MSTKSANITKADIQYMLNNLRDEIKVEFKHHRDETQTLFDKVMGELGTLRDENIIGAYQTREVREDVDDLKKRVKKLEQTRHTS